MGLPREKWVVGGYCSLGCLAGYALAVQLGRYRAEGFGLDDEEEEGGGGGAVAAPARPAPQRSAAESVARLDARIEALRLRKKQ